MSDEPLAQLIAELGRLPGIGQRSAARLAYYIVKNSSQATQRSHHTLAEDLAQALLAVSRQVGLCEQCQNLSTAPRCTVCGDSRRDGALLCVVEEVADLRAIEAIGSYRGLYHVLHGALAPLDGVGPSQLRLQGIVERIAAQQVREVILATNANVEGDATALYVARLVKPCGVRVTRLACGVPMGGELEYIDAATLGRALAERREF